MDHHAGRATHGYNESSGESQKTEIMRKKEELRCEARQRVVGLVIGVLIAAACGALSEANALDYDGDGMSDVWQRAYDAEQLDADADEDGDGLSNYQESLAGTDPWDALDTLEARIETDGFGILIRWDAVRGKAYAIETSQDLEHWEAEANLRTQPQPAEGMVDPLDSVNGVFQRDPKAPSGEAAVRAMRAVSDVALDTSARFYRLRLIYGGQSPLDTDAWEDWILATRFGDEDPDGDGLSNAQEYAYATSPYNPDTDGGGLMDGYEVARGSDPTARGSDPTARDGSERPKRNTTSPVGLVIYTPGVLAP